MRRTLLLTTAAILMLGTAGTAAANQDAAKAGQPKPSASEAATESPAAGDLAGMQNLMGRAVTGSDGQALGEISDIVLNQGTERANVAIIDTGEADGGGDKLIAVDYTLLDVADDSITARNVTREQAAAMPAFEYSESMVSLGRNGGDKSGAEPAK